MIFFVSFCVASRADTPPLRAHIIDRWVPQRGEAVRSEGRRFLARKPVRAVVPHQLTALLNGYTTHPAQGVALPADPIELIPKRHHFGDKLFKFMPTLHFRLAVGSPGGERL